jgi:hypothetical protein
MRNFALIFVCLFMVACGSGPQVVIHNHYPVARGVVAPRAATAVAPATTLAPPPAPRAIFTNLSTPQVEEGPKEWRPVVQPPDPPAERLRRGRAEAADCRRRVLEKGRKLSHNELKRCYLSGGLTPDGQRLRD